jgi:hypothetical protein
MKKAFLISIMSILLISCMTSNFALTGNIYDTLPEDYPVKVILRENIENIQYEEIGALQIRQSDMNNLSRAIDLAKKEARTKGGDIIILISSDSQMGLFGTDDLVMSSEINTYIFIIGRMIL